MNVFDAACTKRSSRASRSWAAAGEGAGIVVSMDSSFGKWVRSFVASRRTAKSRRIFSYTLLCVRSAAGATSAEKICDRAASREAGDHWFGQDPTLRYFGLGRPTRALVPQDGGGWNHRRGSLRLNRWVAPTRVRGSRTRAGAVDFSQVIDCTGEPKCVVFGHRDAALRGEAVNMTPLLPLQTSTPPDSTRQAARLVKSLGRAVDTR